MQENIQLATHTEIEALKKEKLQIKDELYEYLKKKITIIVKKPADAGFFIIEINYRHK